MKKLHKKIALFLLTAVFSTAFYHSAKTQNTPQKLTEPTTCYIDNHTFQAGEEITYKLYYNLNFIWIPAGEVVFRIDDFGNVFRISADGKTYPSYDWVFKVRDRYESYIDKNTLLPNMSVRDVREGGYTLYDKTVLNQEQQRAVIERGRSKEKIHDKKEMDIDNCMHDILSIIYYARNLDYDNMEKGAEVPVKIFMDKEEWPLTVKYDGRDASKKIKGLGKFKTIKFSPQVIVGDIFKEDTQMHIWVTDDENKIPLLIESPISVGSVKAVLKDYKGLRHEMTSLVGG